MEAENRQSQTDHPPVGDGGGTHDWHEGFGVWKYVHGKTVAPGAGGSGNQWRTDGRGGSISHVPRQTLSTDQRTGRVAPEAATEFGGIVPGSPDAKTEGGNSRLSRPGNTAVIVERITLRRTG